MTSTHKTVFGELGKLVQSLKNLEEFKSREEYKMIHALMRDRGYQWVYKNGEWGFHQEYESYEFQNSPLERLFFHNVTNSLMKFENFYLDTTNSVPLYLPGPYQDQIELKAPGWNDLDEDGAKYVDEPDVYDKEAEFVKIYDGTIETFKYEIGEINLQLERVEISAKQIQPGLFHVLGNGSMGSDLWPEKMLESSQIAAMLAGGDSDAPHESLGGLHKFIRDSFMPHFYSVVFVLTKLGMTIWFWKKVMRLGK